jgi:hypothetical protein
MRDRLRFVLRRVRGAYRSQHVAGRGRLGRAPARQAGIALLALSLPLTAAGTAPGPATLRVPSAADVRASAIRLLDWATDTHAAAPKAPVQQSGSASGRPGQVPAAVTSAVGRAAGTTPGEGRGQVPQFEYHAPSEYKFVTGPA